MRRAPFLGRDSFGRRVYKKGGVKIAAHKRGRVKHWRREKNWDPSMGSLTATALRLPLLLLLTVQPQGRANAHPMYNSASAAELADFKTLLDRLEDKLPSEEAEAGLTQEMNEQNEEAPGDASRPLAPWNGEYARPQREGLAYGRDSGELPEKPTAALRSKLRALLNSPRSMRRFSDCFGQRIDRIGALSGLGCNNYRL